MWTQAGKRDRAENWSLCSQFFFSKNDQGTRFKTLLMGIIDKLAPVSWYQLFYERTCFQTKSATSFFFFFFSRLTLRWLKYTYPGPKFTLRRCKIIPACVPVLSTLLPLAAPWHTYLTYPCVSDPSLKGWIILVALGWKTHVDFPSIEKPTR